VQLIVVIWLLRSLVLPASISNDLYAENTMYIGELGGVTDADWALDNGGYLRWFNVIYADWALDNGGYLRWFNVIYGDNMNHVGGCRVLLSETSLCD
jgi:hypothetical protein